MRFSRAAHDFMVKHVACTINSLVSGRRFFSSPGLTTHRRSSKEYCVDHKWVGKFSDPPSKIVLVLAVSNAVLNFLYKNGFNYVFLMLPKARNIMTKMTHKKALDGFINKFLKNKSYKPVSYRSWALQ